MPVTRRPAHLDVPPSGPSLVTRNLRLERGRTSIRLERVEWAALDAICTSEGIDRHAFATRVDRDPMRHEKTLTSRVRSAILTYFISRSGIGATPPVALGDGGFRAVRLDGSGQEETHG
ncbi:ribbon-helix-helix domain-containing protein [Ferrovibrio xuzhouensis]|uniref:Ribbon-helix-helix domain-containing protein n=1 Tax=Ferrovibrio xuzhouensis TaxID=1576914 RepID=A0ABV7VFZ3_9PROT